MSCASDISSRHTNETVYPDGAYIFSKCVFAILPIFNGTDVQYFIADMNPNANRITNHTT